MCLIAYSPDGALLARDVFDTARAQNGDGIGIMSTFALERFVGRRAGRRAWKVIQRLADDGIPYAVHFRWRTHGPVNEELCHPFKSGDGKTFVMHNGVISIPTLPGESDTQVFVREFVDFGACKGAAARTDMKETLEDLIGWGNKLVLLDMPTGEFTICNEDSGTWVDGVWYSQTYSLPTRMKPRWVYKFATEDTYPIPADSLRWPTWEDERDAQLNSPTARLKRGSKRGTLRLAYADGKEMAPIDSERSYYRAARQDAGFYDDGHDVPTRQLDAAGNYSLDDDDYRAMLREAAIAGMSH